MGKYYFFAALGTGHAIPTERFARPARCIFETHTGMQSKLGRAIGWDETTQVHK